MLLENPSTYLSFSESPIPEIEFLDEISQRTGCGLLLDVNNVFVSARNLALSRWSIWISFPSMECMEIHLGGHHEDTDENGRPLLIDAHGTPVADAVWALYRHVIARTGPWRPLIEWDNDVPDWPTLRAEATRSNGSYRSAPASSA